MFMHVGRTSIAFLAVLAAVLGSGTATRCQDKFPADGATPAYFKPTQLPNPYRLVEGWPTLPKTMNGGHWGEVIRVHIAPNGNIWVFNRCFNTIPPGSATCVNRGESNPPILEFDPAGKLLTSFGAGLFAYPHGFTVDGDGNLWTSDVNKKAEVLGMPAKNADGVVMGQEVLKLTPTGKILMTLGKEGVAGNGNDTFDGPAGVAIASNGDIFVADGHGPPNGRIMKFSKDGKFIKSWGHLGAAPGDFDTPHDISIGGSQNRVYVADRNNNRIQVFDQDGNFIVAWTQFGHPSSVFVGRDDSIYVGTTYSDATAPGGEIRGIMIGNVRDGSLKAFIPDPSDLTKRTDRGTSASGIAPGRAGAELRRMITEAEPFATAGVIVAEVLQGLTRDVPHIEHHLRQWEMLEPGGFGTYREAAALFRLVRAKGLTLTTIDTLIVAIALEHDASVFTLDKDFTRMARITRLRLYPL